MLNIHPAYNGSEKYIFISYAHKDKGIVLPFIAKLQDEGFRVWYDDGIDPGTEWARTIADKLESCECFISMMSQNYLDSDNCMDELEHARNKIHNRFIIYIEEVGLPNYIEMRHGRIQNMHMALYADMSLFYEKLFCADIFRDCRADKQHTDIKNPYADGTAELTVTTAGMVTIGYAGGAYTGEVKDGIPHGKGKIRWNDGTAYEGDWKDGKRTGKGVYIFVTGTTYAGDFKDGRFHGRGIYTWSNGDVYEGDFIDNKRTGSGRIEWKNGTVYEGGFIDGKPHGRGRYIWTNGTVYEGDFADGKRTGKGRLTYPSGTVYEGEFSDGKLHGHGKKTYPDGRVEEGRWENDVFIG